MKTGLQKSKKSYLRMRSQVFRQEALKGMSKEAGTVTSVKNLKQK